MENTSGARASLPEDTTGLKLPVQPLLESTPTEPSLTVTGQRGQQEVSELARSAELVDAAWRHAEDGRHCLDGANGRQRIADAEDRLLNVESAAISLRLARLVYIDDPSAHTLAVLQAATTRLRLHLLVLRDALDRH